jgi:hypothetical protein
MKKIDFEAHFVTSEYVRAMKENNGYPRYGEDPTTGNRRLYYTADVGEPLRDVLLNKLLDFDEGRIAQMDKAGVDVQVLSLTSPGVEQFEPALGKALAGETNDALYAAIQRHPDRYLGFAAVAIQDPVTASEELERAVRKLGFKGWKTHSNYAGKYLDDEEFWPILATAEKLDVPVFLHPAVPAIPQLQKYGFALGQIPAAQDLLGSSGRGDAFSDAAHRLRLCQAVVRPGGETKTRQNAERIFQGKRLCGYERQLSSGGLPVHAGDPGDRPDPPCDGLPVRGPGGVHAVSRGPALERSGAEQDLP